MTLIAGGAGITPIYQLARGILCNAEDRTAITLVLGMNSDKDMLLREELDALEKRFPGRFRAVYTASEPVEGSALRKGYVTQELLDEVLTGKREGSKVFICGPPAMERALTGKSGVLEQLGYKKDQIHKF